MRRSNTLAIALFAGLTLVLAACSSDKDNKRTLRLSPHPPALARAVRAERPWTS
jgi:uncharacterized lipoprotein YmbA